MGKILIASNNLLDPNIVIQDTYVKDMKIGDILPNNNKILGIATMKNSNPLYKIHDMYFNKYQKIKYKKNWICAYKHPDAVLSNYIPSTLIGLITSNKTIEYNKMILQDEYFI